MKRRNFLVTVLLAPLVAACKHFPVPGVDNRNRHFEYHQLKPGDLVTVISPSFGHEFGVGCVQCLWDGITGSLKEAYLVHFTYHFNDLGTLEPVQWVIGGLYRREELILHTPIELSAKAASVRNTF